LPPPPPIVEKALHARLPPKVELPPPPTVEYVPLAVLHFPPLTVEQAPLAVLLFPTLTVEHVPAPTAIIPPAKFAMSWAVVFTVASLCTIGSTSVPVNAPELGNCDIVIVDIILCYF
jgi:hypothetical protein